jgi:carbonic anhydrase
MAGHQTGADADVIRNVGTAATEDVVRSLMFSIHVLGVKEIMVIGHTGCGMEMFTEEKFEDHIHHPMRRVGGISR